MREAWWRRRSRGEKDGERAVEEVAGEKGGVRRRRLRGEKGGGREPCRRSRGGRHGRNRGE